MHIVRRKDAKALRGNRSRSHEMITPDNVRSENFLITLVEVEPGGETPPHRHPDVESMYFVIEGTGEVTAGKAKARVGPNTAVHFPTGSTHGIRNVGRRRLRFLSCHAPPYDIERLYETWAKGLMVTGG